ncbi:MAG TPA: hypothetical protein HPP94_03460 [Desulfuromonadales bacterium]|nr:hypothetical protein [Desulfuromonadales bacterium]
MKTVSRMIAVCFITLVMCSRVFAAQLFDLNLTVNASDSMSRSYSNVSDMFNGLTQEQISASIPTYTSTSPLNAKLNFRGLPITVTAVAGSASMKLEIPALGVNQTFSGTTRDDSQTQLEDWFKKNGGDTINKLMKKLAETTATDPIAGNPNSAMAQSVATDFTRGFLNTATSLRETNAASAPATSGTTLPESNANTISLAARFGSLSQGGSNSQSFTLPLAYTVRFQDPLESLSVSMPVTMVDIEGSKSYSIGLGVGYSFPISKSWVITPSVGYTATGSADMASAGQILSGSLTSSYSLPISSYQLSMGNMAGYYRTLPLDIGEYSFDPKIENYVVRNGLMLYIPTEFLFKETGLEVFGIDTRYMGDALFIDSYDEFGISFGRTRVERKNLGDMVKNILTDIRLGVTYITAKATSGFTVNLGYSF